MRMLMVAPGNRNHVCTFIERINLLNVKAFIDPSEHLFRQRHILYLMFNIY